jgi:hypothetical protein
MLRKLWLVVVFASIAVTSSVLACDGEACQDIAIKTDAKGAFSSRIEACAPSG